jgi:hypothetical protein
MPAHRYGLVKVAPSIAEREGGWRQVWAHPSGRRAAKHPSTGMWVVTDGRNIADASFSSSLRAVAAKLHRLAESDAA